MSQSLFSDLSSFGDRLAIAHGGERLTYAELDERASAIASRLGDARSLVLIATDSRLDALITYVAAVRAGHVVLPVADENVDRLASTYRPDVVARSIDGRWDIERLGTPGTDLHPDLALVLSTSGSTGAAKAVRLSHENLRANAEAIAEYLEIDHTDCAALTLPLHYCYGLSVVHSHLSRGAAIALSEHSVVDDCFWKEFEDVGATSLAGVPFTFELLDRSGFDRRSLPSLRYITQAGGRLAPEAVRRYAALGERDGWKFYVMYGQTEATARMAYLPPDMAGEHPDCIGRPIPGGEFDLRPIDGADDDSGELVYRGPNVMMGYASSRADLTRGKEVDELATGDIARRETNGLWRVLGRRSRFVKLFGLRIDLDEVERRLREDGIEATCTGNDSILVVATERRCASVCVASAVQQRFGLTASAIRVVFFEEGVPRLASGKPDYVAIEAGGRSGHSCRLATAAAASVPSHRGPVVRAFAAALNLDHVPTNKSFVELGGDSMSYVEMSVVLERELGHLPQQWHTRSVAELEGARRSPRRFKRVEANVMLRAVAIVLVVGTHATMFDIQGGAHALLAIAGYNFARFWLRDDGGRTPALRRISRIAIPAVGWVGIQAAIRPEYGWANVAMINNYVDSGWWSYWFVETLLQILCVLAIVLAVPAVRRLEARHRFAFPCAVFVAAVLMRFHLNDTGATNERMYTTHIVFFFFVLGWMAYRASSHRQKAVVAVATLATAPFAFYDKPRGLLIAAAILLLVYVAEIPAPRLLARIASLLASASLFIYLTHYLLVFPLVWPWLPKPFTVLACLLMGIAAWRAYETLNRLVSGRTRRRRSEVDPAPGGASVPRLETSGTRTAALR